MYKTNRWILLLFLSLFAACANTNQDSDAVASDSNTVTDTVTDTDTATDTASASDSNTVTDTVTDTDTATDTEIVVQNKCITLPDNLKPQVTDVNGIKVVILKGTAYEMGQQHAKFFKNELTEGVKYIKTSIMNALLIGARNTGLDKTAMKYSYKEIIDECQGMSDATNGVWPVDMCVDLSYGDVILDALKAGKTGTKCSQFVAFGDATTNGQILHGRNLDWDKIDYLLKYPIIIIRIPDNQIPYMTVGYPGNVAPYTGINACGLAIGMNEAESPDDVRAEGRSHNQMARLILETCHNVDEAEAFIRSQKQASAENFCISDTKTARVFEMTATHMGIRNPVKDLVYVTNHFTSTEMLSMNDPTVTKDSSTVKRFTRLQQMLDPDGKDTLYGSIDVAAAVSVLRDRHDPYTGKEYANDIFDNDSSLATNGNIYSMVFVNKALTVYLALGKSLPVPNNPYYPFDMRCLLGLSGCQNNNPIQ